ncbi:MAG: hypothetical protein RLZ98_194 [Pseudomonadota bacterium]|jgi:uncharacterized OB-fold protein
MSDYKKPIPHISPEAEPFWVAAREHKLKIPKCNNCSKSWFPPTTICPHCGSIDFGWTEASGAGKVHTFVTYHRLYHKGWEGELPYVVAVVELAEGPRMMANIVGIEPGKVVCDMPVKVVFDDVTPELTIPKFEPA